MSKPKDSYCLAVSKYYVNCPAVINITIIVQSSHKCKSHCTGNSTTCGKYFYLYNVTRIECKLLCDAWVNPGDSYALLETILTIMSTLFCLFMCVILALVAFTLQRDEM